MWKNTVESDRKQMTIN